MKADAVFEGGGVKGIGLVGAVCYLEEIGYKWQRLAGTSAGAIVAALLAVGYSGKELKKILEELDYSKILDKNPVQRIPVIGSPLSLLKHKGLYHGKWIENWMQKLLEVKEKTKFKDITFHDGFRLKLIATDITKRQILILPDDLRKYNIDPMEFDIAKAVRMSMSIPFYFNPVILSSDNEESYIVDGGLLSNFPVWIFDVKEKPRWPTIGFKLNENEKSNTSSGKTNIVAYALDIINTILDRNEEIYLRDKDRVRTILIPTLGIKTTEFDITKTKSNDLFTSGFNAAEEFLSKWNFKDYVERYR